jgi:hypothetical protein
MYGPRGCLQRHPAAAYPFLVRPMKLLRNADLFFEFILPLGLALLAIVAYRVERTTVFLLLMLACVCYALPYVVPLLIGLFFEIRGWNTSGGFATWAHAWWPIVARIFHFLYLGLMLATLTFFIRERRRHATPKA